MAGALLGACDTAPQPPEQPLDSPYLLSEADRLTAISQGHQIDNHQYPDTLTWVAPQTQADALVIDDHQLAVEGLGSVKELGSDPSWSPRKDFAWQWVQTDFGQTLLIKRRPEIRSRKASNTLTPPLASPSPVRHLQSTKSSKQVSSSSDKMPIVQDFNIDGVVNYARKNIDDNKALGLSLRQTARTGTIEDMIALAIALREELRSS
jgi:hypothetical protein